MESNISGEEISKQLQFFFEKLDIPKEFDMQKMTLKEYVNSLDTAQEEIPEYICCNICMCLVHQPMVCNKCKHATFCDTCISGWLEKDKSKECPCCRQIFETSKPGKEAQIKIDSTLIAVQDLGEQMFIEYKGIQAHFEDRFIKGVRQCPLECGIKLSIKQAP